MADQATEATTPASEQDQSQSTTGAPTQDQRQTTENPEYFSNQFDVNTLDEPLRDRYRQMEAGLTQKFQEVAEQRKQAESQIALASALQSDNPAERQHAIQWLHENGLLTDELLSETLGYQFEDDQQPEDDPGEPEPFLTRAEWEQYQAQIQQQAAQSQQSQQEQYIAAADQHLGSEIARINAQLTEQGRPELTDRQEKLIVKNALVDTQPGQLPDVQTAYDEFAGVLDEGLKSWAGSKHPGATTGGGQAATQVPDLDNMSRAERDAEMTRMWREADQQGGP